MDLRACWATFGVGEIFFWTLWGAPGMVLCFLFVCGFYLSSKHQNLAFVQEDGTLQGRRVGTPKNSYVLANFLETFEHG